jgi:hypothetical protein
LLRQGDGLRLTTDELAARSVSINQTKGTKMDGKQLKAILEDIQEQLDHIYSLHGQQPQKKQLEQLKMSESTTYTDPKTGHLMLKPQYAHEPE